MFSLQYESSVIFTQASGRHMRQISYFLVVMALPAFVAGCALNSVSLLPTGAAVNEGRAIVVLGVGVEGDWRYAGFSVELDEYSIQAQAATGNCFHFNRMNATVPSAPGPTRYFAFDVPAGAYVYSPFNGAPLAPAAKHDATAFAAPPGKIVYIGDFTYLRDRVVALRRDLDAFSKARAKSLPNLRGEVLLAETEQVQDPKPFMCTP